MNITLSEMAEKLSEHDEYRIVYHIRPDGDCIGSSYALSSALQSLGKKCEVAGRDEVPRVHKILTDKVKQYELIDPVYISVDTASMERTGDYCNEHFTFCIDHHRDNSVEADFKYIEADCGACSEIIFKLINAMGVEVTPQIADLLYTGLVTDTMCFRTSDTSIQSFETAAALAKCGADIYGVGRRNTFIKSRQRIRIEEMLRESFNFTCDSRILTGIITLDDLKTADILDSDLEGINSLTEQVEGVMIGVTIRELPDGRMRCSVRTKGDIYADKICAVHGGGGHLHAACCELDAAPDEARKIMEETCREFIV
jgi:phosphoesterase RecJ-like protein